VLITAVRIIPALNRNPINFILTCMVKRNAAAIQNLIKMKQSWDKLQSDLLNVQTHIEELLDILPLSTIFYKKRNALNKAWKCLQKSAADVDAFITPVKSVKVACPLLDDPEFKESWKFWKDYLAEQHGIIMRSRAELMSLKRLMEISGNDAATAVKTLEFVMSRPTDKNFYKIKEADLTPAGPVVQGQKTVVKLPVNYIQKANTGTELPRFHQKTIQEEIRQNEINKLKNQ